MIDAAWSGYLEPLIRARFPAATAAQIAASRAHAYGGSLIQDIGYYPFGSRFLSNLLHYARSGDFVEAIVSQARTPEEYAFALGTVAHYAADNTGHPAAVNRVVAMLFPKLRQKYGDVVTYVDAPAQHVTVEFSFDVIGAASGSTCLMPTAALLALKCHVRCSLAPFSPRTRWKCPTSWATKTSPSELTAMRCARFIPPSPRRPGATSVTKS